MIRRTSLVVTFLGALLLSSCSGGGSGGKNFVIQTCSLGCSRSGDQIGCGVTAVAPNQEFRIRFNRNVDIRSATNSSFQVVEVGSGTTPPGRFRLDANDPRTLIFQPELSFNSMGQAVFGLTAGKTYNVLIPGTRLDGGPFLRDTEGNPVETRLKCTLVASQPLLDPRPGPPTAAVKITVVDRSDPLNPVFSEDVLPQGPLPAYSGTTITILFDDILNPGTLLDPVSGTSTFLEVFIDPDGDTVGTPGDGVAVKGRWSLQLDSFNLTTTAVFQPDAPLPSQGTGPSPRIVVLRMNPGIADLVGNPVTNSGDFLILPELVVFPTQSLVEAFDDNQGEDGPRSGAPWANNSRLIKGTGGGSGRLGDLFLGESEVFTLNTDMETFASFTDPENFDPNNVLPTALGTTVVGGVFDFSSVTISKGAKLLFTGSNPARLIVRGDVRIDGDLILAGASGATHDGDSPTGGVGGAPGPAGGAGGDGGMRPDGAAFVTVGGTAVNPPPVLYTDVDGKPGTGIPVPDTLNPTGTGASGEGGVAWPQPPTVNPDSGAVLGFPVDVVDVDVVQWDRFSGQFGGGISPCNNGIPGSPGGGGGHGLSGLPAVTQNMLHPNNASSGVVYALPPNALGGDANDLLTGGVTDPQVKSLDPELGFLRGGAGGGGGGAHLQGTGNTGNGIFASGCYGVVSIDEYMHHSGAAGGGGGGALQLQGGRTVFVNSGTLDLSGGDGGSMGTVGLPQSGGGGAGGGVLLQGPLVVVTSGVRRIDISGGAGGVGANGSTGGLGGPGILRIEADLANIPDPNVIAASVAPDPAALSSQYGASPTDIITTGEWMPATAGPSALSGAQSCWIQPTGNFFELVFESDGAQLGWDMTLEIAGLPNPLQSYRGPNDIFGQDLQTQFGNVLDPTGGTLGNGAPVIVRFQGARASGVIADLCNVDLYGTDADIVPGSVTPWVTHPDQLNAFSPRPNMIRFVVVWDRSNPNYSSIVGIHDLTIRVTPD